MKILHKHISTTVIAMTGLVVLVVAGLQIFIGYIEELHNIGWHTYNAFSAFLFVLMSLPHDIYPLFPATALIGCLIGLGRLATQSELIVMQASGVSKLQITTSVIRAAIIMLIVATFIGEWIAPRIKAYAEEYKFKAQNAKELSSVSRSGFWIRSGNNFIYINRASPSGELSGIIRYQFKEQQLISASTAKSGVKKNGQWIFSDVTESQFNPQTVSIQHYPQQIWPLTFNPKLLAKAQVDVDNTTLIGLYQYIKYLKTTSLSTSAAEFTWWERLLQPLLTLVMISLSIPFIFGSLRTMTMGLRIVIGVAIGFGFYTLNEFLGPFSLVYNVPPLWAAVTPVVLFALVGGVLIRALK
ncbi:MAG TPA: LPS export ABC transporter permease LptG [Gammaproteobacteria bacterium]|nr:LPS export ABC transporter permease LptG [Gammaproteobacteria bacterium]